MRTIINKRQAVVIEVAAMLALNFLPNTSVAASGQSLEQLGMFNQQLMQLNKPKADPNVAPINRAAPKTTQGANPRQITIARKGEVSPDEVKSDEEAMNKEAFKMVRKRIFPLKHEQILKLHQDYKAAEFALSSPVGTPPRPAVTTQMVRLDPGSTPSVIRLGQGFISSVVFLDSSGAPWPIIAYDIGDPSAYNIQWDKSGNTLMIQSKKLYTYGNMAIRLQGLNTPVMLTLVPGQKAIDYRVDMRVMGYGPNAKDVPSEMNLPEGANDTLLKILDDIPPENGKLLNVKGGPAKAWSVNSTMYVRTRLTILSPGWLSKMSSADGMNVYKMSDSPVLLVSWHGKVMQLKIEGL